VPTAAVPLAVALHVVALRDERGDWCPWTCMAAS
jgi:hypothetical protein